MHFGLTMIIKYDAFQDGHDDDDDDDDAHDFIFIIQHLNFFITISDRGPKLSRRDVGHRMSFKIILTSLHHH